MCCIYLVLTPKSLLEGDASSLLPTVPWSWYLQLTEPSHPVWSWCGGTRWYLSSPWKDSFNSRILMNLVVGRFQWGYVPPSASVLCRTMFIWSLILPIGSECQYSWSDPDLVSGWRWSWSLEETSARIHCPWLVAVPHTRTHRYTRTHTQTHKQTHTHIRTQRHTHTHNQTDTQSHTDTQTTHSLNTHTHSPFTQSRQALEIDTGQQCPTDTTTRKNKTLFKSY